MLDRFDAKVNTDAVNTKIGDCEDQFLCNDHTDSKCLSDQVRDCVGDHRCHEWQLCDLIILNSYVMMLIALSVTKSVKDPGLLGKRLDPAGRG